MKDYEKMWKEFKHEMLLSIGKAQYHHPTTQTVYEWMSRMEKSERFEKESTAQRPAPPEED